MSDFIVLGLVPGTQMQITFAMWSVLAGAIALYITMRSTYKTQVFRALLIATAISVNTQRRQF